MPRRVLVTYDVTPEHRAALLAAAPGAEVRFVADLAAARTAAPEAEVILGNRFLEAILPAAERVSWVQSSSMGVEWVLAALAGRPGVRLTCARGIYDDDVADHALALLLGIARGLHAARDDRAARRWGRPPTRSLAGTRAMVLGWGGVGRAIARRLVAFGCSVVGVGRRVDPAIDRGPFPFLGPDRWRAELPRTDLLLAALPLTAKTREIVGAAELSALPADAVVVNVGRGETLDQGALLQALGRGHLSGAGLDVFATEPLPPGDQAWDEPRLWISPHLGRAPERPPYRWEPRFEENLGRYFRGEPLVGEVDLGEGY